MPGLCEEHDVDLSVTTDFQQVVQLVAEWTNVKTSKRHTGITRSRVTLDVHLYQWQRWTGTRVETIDMRRRTAAGDEDESAAARWTDDGCQVTRPTSTTAAVAADGEAIFPLRRRRASATTTTTRWTADGGPIRTHQCSFKRYHPRSPNPLWPPLPRDWGFAT